jgi:hypothetical protein
MHEFLLVSGSARVREWRRRGRFRESEAIFRSRGHAILRYPISNVWLSGKVSLDTRMSG